ncbi:hypothetical protein RhiirA4_485140, partial [Rhizophagus irregularis]
MNTDKSRKLNKAATDFVSEFSIVYFHTITTHLGSFVEDGFLKALYDKNPSKTQNNNENFGDMGYTENSDDDESLDDKHDEDKDDLILGLQTPNPVNDTPPILPDVEMTPVDQTVIPENSRKKDKQKARVTDDKQ